MAKAVAQSSIVFEVLEKGNYEDWSEAIEAYLKAQDLWDVVDSNEQPQKTEEEFKAWEKKNAAALHAIKISCGRHFISKIRGIREANNAWRTLQAYFYPPLSTRMEYTINPGQGDEENVDDEYKKAYKSLADGLSSRDISDAIELCKKNPTLLKERLPNYTPLLHQLIMRGCDLYMEDKVAGCDLYMEDKVVEILKLDHFPKEALEMRDFSGRTPLAVAIDSRSYPSLIDELYSITPSNVWTLEDGKYGATLITKCFEQRKFDFALKFLKEHPHLTFAKDVNGISPLYAAARAPRMFRSRIYKFPKFIYKFLLRWLPLHSMDFEIQRIELLIAMRNAIRDLNKTSDLLRDAFFEAIKCGNFNFIVMLINADGRVLREVNDMSKNIYVCAIKYRQAKVFSLIYWDQNGWRDLQQSASVWQDEWKNNLLHVASAWTPPNTFVYVTKPAAMLMLREVMWNKEIHKLAPYLVQKSNVDGKTPYELFLESHKDWIMEAQTWMKESAASWAIIGPLVITIMFGAAFQIPGGYNQETGFPIFLKKKWFKPYMVLVSISLFSATISVLKFLEILSSNYPEKDFFSALRTYNVITSTLFLSLITMLVAFCLGLFLVLHGDLAIFLPIAVVATFLVGYIVYTKFPLFLESFTFSMKRNSLFQKNIGREVERIFEMLNRQPT